MMDWLQLIEKTGEQFFPRFILTVCKFQPEILDKLSFNQKYFIILRISGLSLHTVRINPRKKCAPVFSSANHQQFCNIFSTNYLVGYFSPSLLVQVLFLFRIALQEFFFKIIHPPPPHQKLNGQPLSCKRNGKFAHHVKYGSFYANRNVDSNLTQNSKIVVGPKFMGPLQKHL